MLNCRRTCIMKLLSNLCVSRCSEPNVCMLVSQQLAEKVLPFFRNTAACKLLTMNTYTVAIVVIISNSSSTQFLFCTTGKSLEFFLVYIVQKHWPFDSLQKIKIKNKESTC